MQITLDTSTAHQGELTALIALCASLGGRLPTGFVSIDSIPGSLQEYVLETEDERTAAHAEINQGRKGPPLGDEQPESERLIEQAAAANTAPPPPREYVAVVTDSAVDSKGTPWDARIHSESRATVADGSWRKRRGVDEAIFASVMAELHADAPPPPPAEQSVPNAQPLSTQSAPTEDVPPAPEPAASAPVATDTPPPPAAFDGFPAFVSAVSKHNKNYAELNELAGMVGVAAFKDMKDHADKWDTFYAMLG